MIAFKFGADQPKKRIRDLGKSLAGGQVTFGYSSPYAIKVHENMEMVLKGKQRPSKLGAYWDAAAGEGQSKYLETPFRELANDGTLQRIIATETKQSNVKEGVRKAAQRVIAESRMLVPYEYGDLYRSAYINEVVPLGTQSVQEVKPTTAPKETKAPQPTSLAGRAWQGLKRLFGFGKK